MCKSLRWGWKQWAVAVCVLAVIFEYLEQKVLNVLKSELCERQAPASPADF